MPNNISEYFRYLASSEQDRNWGLYVIGAGYQPSAAGTDKVPQRRHPPGHYYHWETGRILDEFAMIYVTHGKGEFESKITGRIDVGRGDFILLFPGVWHRYRPNKEVGWGLYWVHFYGDHANRILHRGFIDPQNAVLKIGLDDSILVVFNSILDCLRGEPAGFQQIISAQTLEILARALGAVRAGQQGSHLAKIVRSFKLMLEEDPHKLPVIDKLLANFDLSRARFFRVFKEQTGLTPYQYHLQLKMQRAIEMLRSSTMSVKQIARVLNFQSPFHFSKLFKKKNGLCPSEFRSLKKKNPGGVKK
jgi:AraC-like DNA-binding protein/mannose-6-phosphate isomerase-like protein (cupin superfamily)